MEPVNQSQPTLLEKDQLEKQDLEVPRRLGTRLHGSWASKTLRFAIGAGLLVTSFGAGLGTGYRTWGERAPAVAQVAMTATPGSIPSPAFLPTATPEHHAVLPTNYTLAASFGDIGPRLIQAGAFEIDALAAVHAAKGQPLTSAQQLLLTEGSNNAITFDQENSSFLLNLFWALGLTNQNPILTEGLMVTNSGGQVERFASTGGWTLTTVPVGELYASTPLVTLTDEQQKLLEEVAGAVYRPCCDNHTAFPDCNHGMAMLGMLELLASQGANADEMFEAAKYANSFWFPQQSQEIATLIKVTDGADYDDINSRLAVSANFASGSGFARIHQWLADNGHLGQPKSTGGSCGV